MSKLEKKIQKNQKKREKISRSSSLFSNSLFSKMPPGRPPLKKIINALQKKATMIKKKTIKTTTKTKKKTLKIKEEDFFFNSSGGMMMEEEEEEEEENNRILAHGNDDEEKNYEINGMNLKEILTQRLEGRVGGPTRRSAKGGWTPAEDDVLRRAVAIYKGKNWKKIGTILSLFHIYISFYVSTSSPRGEKKAQKEKFFEFEFFGFFGRFFARIFYSSLFSFVLSLICVY